MSADQPYFQVVLNLPHAGRVARRILRLVPDTRTEAGRLAMELEELLAPCLDADENPAQAEAMMLKLRAAELGRHLVDAIEREKLGNDRMGQAVRNLFECLELGREGAAISLRAGEGPNSFQRPS
jgi:hypothetical protein